LNATDKIPGLPRAKIKRQATLSIIWLVPLITGIAAAILVFHQLHKMGPAITIEFADGTGLDPNQTVIRFRGVRVGNVTSVQISKDTRRVEVGARLDRSAAQLAREGTVFWVVRAQAGAGGVHALETIVSGSYIQVQPSNDSGKEQKKFVGLDEPPPLKPLGDGKEFILRSPGLGSLAPGSPIFYRGIEVGSVQFLSLSADSTMVEVHVFVKKNFVPLVRTNTVWWNAGGINVDLYLFGMTLNAENLKSLVVGGISFATPDNVGPLANAGATFTLYDKADPQWLNWAPVIPITNSIMTMSTGTSGSTIDVNNAGQSQK